MITFKSTGSFNRSESYLNRLLRRDILSILNRYGEKGVVALADATPRESGETASLWRYEAKKTARGYEIAWFNDHVEDGVPIAVILQYGHATGTGGYVHGTDYINPAIKPIFDQIAADVWREVKSL